MVSMIKEINDNLRAIVDNLKENLDTSVSTIDNIQMQMDKKVEEAKKYKVQVDEAKSKIKVLEEENKNLELSLEELSDKYSKMNLISLVEAGNREIKSKINNNLKEISKNRDHISDLTGKARTIKDLLISLKNDKSAKTEKLDSIKVLYEYYNNRINDIIDYASNNPENLSNYHVDSFSSHMEDEDVEVSNVFDNTMVFDEIANIDDDSTNDISFDEEVVTNDDSFDNQEIDNTISDANSFNIPEMNDEEDLFNISNINEEENSEESVGFYNINFNEEVNDESNELNEGLKALEEKVNDLNINIDNQVEESSLNSNDLNIVDEVKEDSVYNTFDKLNDSLNIDNNLVSDMSNTETLELDKENEDRLNKINSLFSSVNEIQTDVLPTVNNVESKIDNAYQDVFGSDINTPIKSNTELLDIFGNPISSNEVNKVDDVKNNKSLNDLFIENGISVNKFSEDDLNKLKSNYDEEKFLNIIEFLRNSNINLDNIYNASNIFIDLSVDEVKNIITKLIDAGQSVEAIGLILEKLPKINKYKLDDAISYYGDKVKSIDITELIMKARELYKDGGNI